MDPTVVAEAPSWLDGFVTSLGPWLGVAAAFVLAFDRLAKITPTEADNSVVRIAQRIFAVLGVKVPDIK